MFIPKRRIVGFYTDEKGRVRPITEPIKAKPKYKYRKRKLDQNLLPSNVETREVEVYEILEGEEKAKFLEKLNKYLKGESKKNVKIIPRGTYGIGDSVKKTYDVYIDGERYSITTEKESGKWRIVLIYKITVKKERGVWLY